ncbi:MAG: VOC family protein [Bacteroidia bacterium]
MISAQAQTPGTGKMTKRVTGIGGIFIKAKNPKELAKWYDEHLGIGFGNNLYFSFSWKENDSASTAARTDLGFFSEQTDYFYPSQKQLMLNLRVENLELLVENLKKEDVSVQDKIDKYAYGNFGWINDIEGNKIELWEPVDSGFGEDEKIIAERMKSLSRVTGIGGIFFKAADNKKLAEWYDRHLGIVFSETAHIFAWNEFYDTRKKGNSVFSIFKESTKYFEPSQKEFMINFRVKNLEPLLQELKNEGVTVVGEFTKYDYGNFGWIMDPEGNKIELWEAVEK